ncbi:MAG: hypothetical protein HUU08_06740 [Candidatus Brocadia sp.]|nr:hypothetical protein [Candidatus Brocadia sp.]
MDIIKLQKYLMFKPKTAIDISPEIYEALCQITVKNPRLSVNLLIDIALDYISNLKEEDLLKLITEYYGRTHISPPSE